MSDHGPRRAILGQLPRMYRADGSPIRVLLVDDERALTNLDGMNSETRSINTCKRGLVGGRP